MHKVRFISDNAEADVPDGTLISEAAKAANVRVELPCNGKGRCGKCVVFVSEKENGESERVLACQTATTKDIFVKVPKKEGSVIAANDHRKLKINELSPIVKMKDGTNYGLAIDIGTTTIAVSILDMNHGIELYTATGENRQRLLGEDVLARIQHASEGGTEELRSLVLESINDLIDVCLDRRCNPHSVRSVYVSGNTAMTHLFLGIDPTPIREEPYEPVIRESEVTGKESKLLVNPDARVICMPSVSAYVGGDVTSDIVAASMDIDGKTSIMIDVGTNGEVALGNNEMMIVCSSSAGPAFEGGSIRSGMLARAGAIDSISIVNNELKYTVIAGKEPLGICGSGLIDLIAELFKAGWIDKKGYFTERSKFEIENDGDETKFIRIAGDVIITQEDISTIILTKASIFSSIRSLLMNVGMDISDIENIYIAGGFGNFINIESAISIGLFPDVPRDKYVYLGNASLAGAKYALLSRTYRKRIAEVFKRMTYLDLSSNAVFFEEYSSAQFLPHTNISLFPSSKGE